MESNKHIDETLRQKLESLEAGYDPASWDKLAHRMDFEAQQEVDDVFKNRLEGMNAAIPTGSWEAMEQLIEADEATELIGKEAQVDSITYDKLHNLRAPYNEQHWALMAKRLEEEYSIRYQIYRFKIAEIALMALLLLTIIRFAPMVEGWLQNDPEQQEIIQLAPNQPIASADQADNQHDRSDNQASIGNAEIIRGINILENRAPDTDLGFTTNKKVLRNGQPIFNFNSIADQQPTTESPSNLVFGSELPEIQPLSNSTLAELNYASNINSKFEEKARELIAQNHLLAYSKDKKSQPKLLSPIVVGGFETDYAWELPSVKINPSNKKSDLRFSIFTSTDYNYVTTPPTRITGFGQPIQTKRNETIAMGYGGGVNISWKKDRWEYQTGGIYSFKRYIPNTPIVIFETINFWVTEDFNGIQLDILQLPFNFLYHFKNSGKWRFYASAGVSSHFVTKTVYEFETEREALEGSGGSSPDDTKSIKKYKDFPNGLADGGKLRDNFYMSANLGLGAEYYLSPKWTIFLQPNYQHFMLSSGIGTNKDKIYTTSLYLGTKFNLK